MLAELAVRDLGVIEDLSLVLAPGMTALTGETGAGKTMVVGAIGLLAGERADPTAVRPGASEATVQGRFVVDDTEVVLTRVVPRNGRSRAYRDGRMLSVGELAEAVDGLVERHGQHGHLRLASASGQRDALDRFASVDLGPWRAARDALAAAQVAVAELGGDPESRARELELARHRLADLERAALDDPDEDDRLRDEEELLSGVEARRDAIEAAREELDAEGGARDRVAGAAAALGSAGPLAGLAGRLSGLVAELDDVSSELRVVLEAVVADPERLDAVARRRRELVDLRRRHLDDGRAPLGDLLVAREELRAGVAALESHGERAERADADLRVARAALEARAAELGAARRRSAPRLAAALQSELVQLALPRAEVSVTVGADPGDEVTILLAPNPGLPAAPLARAASGGELARTMLALRLVISAEAPTVVFDEVDAGVGGSAARAVGRALARVAESRQVLVVTHLPQVAAFADSQVRLTKAERAGMATVSADSLDDDGRVAELARMLSGMTDSRSGRDHASELLAAASAERGR